MQKTETFQLKKYPKKILKDEETTSSTTAKNSSTKTSQYKIEKINKKEEEEIETIDFKLLIERRFNKSVANKIYSFPVNENFDSNSFEELEESDSSINSIKNCQLYNLHSQNYKNINNKRKIPDISLLSLNSNLFTSFKTLSYKETFGKEDFEEKNFQNEKIKTILTNKKIPSVNKNKKSNKCEAFNSVSKNSNLKKNFKENEKKHNSQHMFTFFNFIKNYIS